MHVSPSELLCWDLDSVGCGSDDALWFMAQRTRVYVYALDLPWGDCHVGVTIEGVSEPLL